MKKIIKKPLAVMMLAAFTMYGCSSSNETTNATAMDGTTMSETAAMGGNTMDQNELEVLVVEEQVMVPVATVDITALAMNNPVEVNDMFEDLGDTEQYDVLTLARTNPNLSTFVKLIEQANLVDDLQRVEELTLFAPTNEAFAKMPKDKLESLLLSDNVAQLSRMLQAHVLTSEVTSLQLEDNTRIRVTDDSYIPIESRMAGNVTLVGGAQIVKGDIEASNGRIHVIDNVIMPSEDAREEGPLR